MGSFYALCSVTNKTICDGQDMVVQFMVPSWHSKNDSREDIGQIFVESFLSVVKEKGLDEALKSWEESTSTWSGSKQLSPKGMNVSNDGALREWVPIGPAIRGKYDDCGNIALDQSEENLKRVNFLENLLFGVPFDSIMKAATDDRWFTLGLGKYADSEDSMWKVKGLDKKLPEPALEIFKKLSVTYIHASVYDEMSKFDFSPEEGTMKSKYDVKWKKEYIDPAVGLLKKGLKTLIKYSKTEEGLEKFELKWKGRESFDKISIFRCMNRELDIIYKACLAREMNTTDFSWFTETLNFTYALNGMMIHLERSGYGSQHQNWLGWKRLEASLSGPIEKSLTDYGYYDQEDEDEDDE